MVREFRMINRYIKYIEYIYKNILESFENV